LLSRAAVAAVAKSLQQCSGASRLLAGRGWCSASQVHARYIAGLPQAASSILRGQKVYLASRSSVPSSQGLPQVQGSSVQDERNRRRALRAAGSYPPLHSAGHARARQARPAGRRRSTLGRPPPEPGEASGSVNRSLRPDSVRHMSVTTAMQRLTTAHHDTQRDNSKASREPGYAQATGRFRRWWQVLGSNQRRLSRRFYRPLALQRSYTS